MCKKEAGAGITQMPAFSVESKRKESIRVWGGL